MALLLVLAVVAVVDYLVVYRFFRWRRLLWVYHLLVCGWQLFLFLAIPILWLRCGCLAMAVVHAYSLRDEWRNRRNRRGRVGRLLGYKGRALRAKLLAALPPGGRVLRPILRHRMT